MRLTMLAACLVAAAVCPVAPAALAAEFHVSPTGSDQGPGTRTRPFRTLEAARDAVRRAKGRGGATVYLGAGDHVLEFVTREWAAGALHLTALEVTRLRW